MTVQEAQQRVTSSEFPEWMAFLDWEVNSFHREDYFLAQIAAEIRRFVSKDPKGPKITDFLLKFVEEKPTPTLSRAERLKRSKSAWLAAVGMTDAINRPPR